MRDSSEAQIEGGMSKSIAIILHGENLYSWVQKGNDDECKLEKLNWISTVDICGFKIDQSDQLYFLYKEYGDHGSKDKHAADHLLDFDISLQAAHGHTPKV